jgi:Na+-translocating membrane potential-generating system (MpsC)
MGRSTVEGDDDRSEDLDDRSEDLAELREPGDENDGPLRSEISRAVVSLYKKHYGKGPTRCRTYLQPELVVVVLGEGYTASEQTMFEGGRWHAAKPGSIGRTRCRSGSSRRSKG